jgi:hypothetical protein
MSRSPIQITNLSRESILTRLQDNGKDKNKNITLKTDKEKLNNVIVLADNKNYSRDFLSKLGMTSGSPYLCTIHVPTKMFTYQTYGLEESDTKIFNHVTSNAGLVIIVQKENYLRLYDRIKFYTENISHIPILIVIENIDTNELDRTFKTYKIISFCIKMYDFI